jgi:hypothetical protein
MMTGEVFVDGQNRNVWCNSKTPITDLRMYNSETDLTDPAYAIVPSCFVLWYVPVVGYLDIVMYMRSGSECLASYPIVAVDYFLCE